MIVLCYQRVLSSLPTIGRTRKSGAMESLSANLDAAPRSAYLIRAVVQRCKGVQRKTGSSIESAAKGAKMETRASIQHTSSFRPNLELAPNQHSRPRERDDST